MPTRFYNQSDRSKLASAQTFHDVGNIALDVLSRMPADGHIIMVCGPITSGGKGNPQANMLTMTKAVDFLVKSGHLIFNQLPLEEATARLWHKWYQDGGSGYCWDLLTDIYLRAFQTGRIRELRFLPDWQSSTGARWENEQGTKHGMILSHFDLKWEIEADRLLTAA